MINLYVDDLRICPDGFIKTTNYEDTIKMLKSEEINILSLDHDLGLDSNGKIALSGYDIVKYICENNIKINRIYLHTDNVVGRENMYQTLLAAQRRGFIEKDIKIYHYGCTINRY